MGDLSKNFSRYEFECPCCGGGKGEISLKLVKVLQAIRDDADRPVSIISGYRCTKHNSSPKVGGAAKSAHLGGYAADIYVKGMSNKKLGALIKDLYKRGKLPELQYCYLIKGKTNTGVHVDVDESKADIRWRVFAF